MIDLVILVDYRGQLYSSTRWSTSGIDLEQFVEALRPSVGSVEILTFEEAAERDLKDRVLLAQSSEDKGSHYKAFIIDVLRYLEKSNRVIPSVDYYQAHDNKVFSSLLIKNMEFDFKVPEAKLVGTAVSLQAENISLPCVLKSAGGSTSSGVVLARTKRQLMRSAKKLSNTKRYLEAARFVLKRVLKKNYVPETIFRERIIIQEFIPGLAGDYKVLVFGKRFYGLRRENRKNDFRASGSGIFDFSEVVPDEVLDAARTLYLALDVPFLSVDLAFSNGDVYLIEYQCVMFGTVTQEKGTQYYFRGMDETWKVKDKTNSLAEDYAEAIKEYLND